MRPERNNGGNVSTADLVNTYTVPQQVQIILHEACYDCHSNNTH